MLNMNLDTQLDRSNNLHILSQTGAHFTTYFVINPDGDLIKRQTYEFAVRPHLKFDENVNVMVSGATRQERDTDLPRPLPAEMKPAELK